MRAEIAGIDKHLKYGTNCGFDSDIAAPLSHELWASLRYSMLKSLDSKGKDYPEIAEFDTKNIGYFISKKRCVELKEKADKLFSSVYLG